MPILVTGGAGFIGSNLVEKLLNEGNDVITLDNFDNFYDPDQKRLNVEKCLKNPHFTLVEGDIRDEETLKNLFQNNNIETVVHLAARAGVRPSLEQPKLYQEVNYLGTLVLLENARKFGVKKFVFGSSSSVYGERSEVPFHEIDRVDRPISPYGLSKAAGEELCYVYHHLYGISVVALRFFTVYGPRQRPDLAIRKFIRAINRGEEITMFGDGSTERDYTFVSDIVEGINKSILKADELGFEIINLGNSNPVSLKQLITIIEEKVGKKANVKQSSLQPGDVSRTYADISKAKKVLDWEPKVKIEEGLSMMVKWYKDLYDKRS